MNIRPIRNEQDYKAALKEVSLLFENPPELNTPEGEQFEVMLTLIESYESKYFPVEFPDPVEAIKFRMEQSGLTVRDLTAAIGHPNRVYEVLNRKRNLTLPMIRRLHSLFGIPAECLIKSTKVGQHS
ncbi:helix-turn-helix domain-containing protein [Hafnia alvei]|uniref:Toxin-antitoxin system, antitoxin component, Xre family n=1 Tax=Hafnia alvei ATCC 51873 TaxID=1002364 RepID=G9Y792_HAFAL|nr:transcriptional regulator [Hafnia alvei]EHM42101.1 toxin-antitoxin system, antitoxin component, Xre family [Hafnia alvei ATCC 51873]QQE44329.1 transcriptional regulator [Hafnia alvei]